MHHIKSRASSSSSFYILFAPLGGRIKLKLRSVIMEEDQKSAYIAYIVNIKSIRTIDLQLETNSRYNKGVSKLAQVENHKDSCT